MSYITFKSSESTGSIGKQNISQNTSQNTSKYYNAKINESTEDTVNFKGTKKEKKSSLFSTLITLASIAGITIVGLGYAHKADLVGKLNEGKFKDFMRKSDTITKPCHDLCSKIKNFFHKKT